MQHPLFFFLNGHPTDKLAFLQTSKKKRALKLCVSTLFLCVGWPVLLLLSWVTSTLFGIEVLGSSFSNRIGHYDFQIVFSKLSRSKHIVQGQSVP